MALELLSGPHEIIDLSRDETLNLDPAYPLTRYETQWVDPWGLLVLASNGLRYVAQMDGSAYPYGQVGGIGPRWLMASLVGANPADPTVGERWYSEVYGGIEAPLTKITKIRDIDNPVSSDVAFLGTVHVHDRYLNTSGSNLRFALGSAGSFANEANVPGLTGTTRASWAREGNEVWMCSDSGQAFRYNYVTKLVTSPLHTIGMACFVMYYSAKHDVFVSLHNQYAPHYMRVWACTPAPASISVPIATPAVKAGLVSTLQCRVLGADADPCPDEVVSWTLTGDGELSALTSATDDDGYAEVQITMPVASAGDAQVDVELSY